MQNLPHQLGWKWLRPTVGEDVWAQESPPGYHLQAAVITKNHTASSLPPAASRHFHTSHYRKNPVRDTTSNVIQWHTRDSSVNMCRVVPSCQQQRVWDTSHSLQIPITQRPNLSGCHGFIFPSPADVLHVLQELDSFLQAWCLLARATSSIY